MTGLVRYYGPNPQGTSAWQVQGTPLHPRPPVSLTSHHRINRTALVSLRDRSDMLFTA